MANGPKLPSAKKPEIVVKSKDTPPPEFHDKILYSPLDNPQTWQNTTKPGLRTTRT